MVYLYANVSSNTMQAVIKAIIELISKMLHLVNRRLPGVMPCFRDIFVGKGGNCAMALVFDLCFQVTEICQTLLMNFVIQGEGCGSDEKHVKSRGGSKGKDVGGSMGAFPLPAIFKNVFDGYNFSIISNLFNKNKPYPLSKRKSKICEQSASYLVKH